MDHCSLPYQYHRKTKNKISRTRTRDRGIHNGIRIARSGCTGYYTPKKQQVRSTPDDEGVGRDKNNKGVAVGAIRANGRRRRAKD